MNRRITLPLLVLALLVPPAGSARADGPPATPPGQGLKTGGAALMITGAVVAGASSVLFLYAAPKRLIDGYGCSSTCDEPPLWEVKAGLIGMGAGVLLAGAGAIMIAAGAHAPAAVAPSERQAAGVSSWRLVPHAGPGATGLVLAGRF